jgi:hypothetical protein
MGRGAVMGLLMGAWGCGHVLPARTALQVELLEDERAQVVDLDTGKVGTLPRGALPRSAREGDVVVNGAVDRELTSALAREVRALHERLAVPVPPGMTLDEVPLTEDPE